MSDEWRSNTELWGSTETALQKADTTLVHEHWEEEGVRRQSLCRGSDPEAGRSPTSADEQMPEEGPLEGDSNLCRHWPVLVFLKEGYGTCSESRKSNWKLEPAALGTITDARNNNCWRHKPDKWANGKFLFSSSNLPYPSNSLLAEPNREPGVKGDIVCLVPAPASQRRIWKDGFEAGRQ